MNYLIIGGTGTVGKDVVAGLLQHDNATVRVLTRSEKHARKVPGGATAVIGDLEDPSTYEKIFAETDRLFLLNSVSMTELHQGLAAVHEAKRVGVQHVVYLSVHDAETIPSAPHIASKVAVEHALKESGIPYTILRPNNFYQNDYWYENAIRTQGVYPQPIGTRGLSRVDTRDVAQAAVNAFTQSGHANKTYTLVGPDVLTGPDCAEIYAELLGRDVQYAGNDLNTWQKQARSMLPEWMAYDFRLMYAAFQERGLVATDAQKKETRTILGTKPRSFRRFAEEIVEQWQERPTRA
jgi:uncharacterized protein YbjT (DUF2867 family)